MLTCEPLKDDFETWMLQLAFYHSADCTVRSADARCSCGLHLLMTKIRAERNDMRDPPPVTFIDAAGNVTDAGQ